MPKDEIRPDHYKMNIHGQDIELKDIFDSLGWSEGFNKANALKYIVRAGRKENGNKLEDLVKARTYINFEVERLEGVEGLKDEFIPNSVVEFLSHILETYSILKLIKLGSHDGIENTCTYCQTKVPTWGHILFSGKERPGIAVKGIILCQSHWIECVSAGLIYMNEGVDEVRFINWVATPTDPLHETNFKAFVTVVNYIYQIIMDHPLLYHANPVGNHNIEMKCSFCDIPNETYTNIVFENEEGHTKAIILCKGCYDQLPGRYRYALERNEKEFRNFVNSPINIRTEQMNDSQVEFDIDDEMDTKKEKE